MFAVAVYTGLRKGELLALRKEDVDLSARLLTVARSHDRETTKGNRADVIPIAEEAVPYFQQAIAASPSELVFPGPDGKQRRRDFKAQAILTRALGRAGIVSGWLLVCRRKGCGYREDSPEAEVKRCPRCSMLLWPKAKPRRLRFGSTTCAEPAPPSSSSLERAPLPSPPSSGIRTRTSPCGVTPTWTQATCARRSTGCPSARYQAPSQPR
jgi:hypothetical protein